MHVYTYPGVGGIFVGSSMFRRLYIAPKGIFDVLEGVLVLVLLRHGVHVDLDGGPCEVLFIQVESLSLVAKIEPC